MKVVVLVISSDGHPVYKKCRAVWEKYMNINPDIHVEFLHEEDMRFDSFQVRITQKTLAGFRKFPGVPILRANLSAVWDWGQLLKIIGEVNMNECFVMGHPLFHLKKPFISGSGMLWSPVAVTNVLKLADEQPDLFKADIPDDVLLSDAAEQAGATLVCHKEWILDMMFSRRAFSTNALVKNAIHKLINSEKKPLYYRCKSQSNRMKFDAHYMRMLIWELYGAQ